MLRIICGKEPYLVSAEKEKLLKDRDVLDVSTFQEVNEDSVSFLYTPSLFGGIRAAVFDVADLSDMQMKAMEYFYDNPPQDTDILIFPRVVDRRTRFYKKLEKKGYVTFYEKVKDTQKIRNLMNKKLNQLGATMEEAAYQEFFARMDYVNNESISLLHMLKELEKLAFHAKSISLEHVKALTPDYRKGNVFLFESIILNRDADELDRQLSLLSADDQFGLLFLLLRSYRIAYKEKLGYTKKEIGCTVIRFHDFSVEELTEGMDILVSTIADLKQGKLSKALGSRLALQRLLSIREKGGKTHEEGNY